MKCGIALIYSTTVQRTDTVANITTDITKIAMSYIATIAILAS